MRSCNANGKILLAIEYLIYKIIVNLVYGIYNRDGSGYNRKKNGVQLNTKSKVEGAITNEE